MTHPTDAERMREACAVHIKRHSDMMEDADAEGSSYTSAGVVRKLRRLAVELSSLPLPPTGNGHDDAAHEGGLMARVENHLRGQVGLPPAPSRPADDAVARALRDIKAMSLGHHAHEDPAVLLHALLVEIPTAIDAALLAAERAAKGNNEGGGK